MILGDYELLVYAVLVLGSFSITNEQQMVYNNRQEKLLVAKQNQEESSARQKIKDILIFI
ncbi:hypothetical protein BpHYR1_032246 [Brachionus plicatilis]|uniref:Uncharacterized protein n=1 Tax=Brachionus plicatilis TaxID=10195 RepID=A0A3M7T9Q8_BRAPC|nr:hypothetical protein BpHYR1_032246 [Brachionus plicatilis]